MRRRIYFAAIILCCIISFCGCVDKKNVDDMMYVLSFGVDKGEEKAYRFTVQAPKLGQSGETDGSQVIKLSVEADDVYRADDLLNASIPFLSDYTHCNFLVISEEIAASKDIFDIMKVTERLGIPKDMAMLIVAKDSAEDFIDGLASDIDLSLAKEQKNLMLNSRVTGTFPVTTIFEYLDGMSSTGDAVAPLGSRNEQVSEESGGESSEENKDTQEGQKEDEGQAEGAAQNEDESQSDGDNPKRRGERSPVKTASPHDLEIARELARDNEANAGGESQLPESIKRELELDGRSKDKETPKDDLQSSEAGSIERGGGLQSEIYGSALFKDGVLVGGLNGRETRMMMIGRGEFKKASLSVMYNNRAHDIVLTNIKRPSINVDISGDIPRAMIKVYLGVALMEDSLSGPDIGLGAVEKEKEEMTRFIKEQLEIVTKKIYDTGCDAYGLGKHFVREFKYINDWEAFDWRSRVAQTQIDWDIHMQMQVTEDRQEAPAGASEVTER